MPAAGARPRSGVSFARRWTWQLRRLKNLGFQLAEQVRYNERTAGERVNGRLKDEFGGRHVRVRGIAGGALDGGAHHRSDRGRAAGLVKVPKVGGEARVVERAAGHGVGAAGVGRRRALEEPDRGLAAGPRDIGEGVTGLAGGHGPHDRLFYRGLYGRGSAARTQPAFVFDRRRSTRPASAAPRTTAPAGCPAAPGHR